MKTIIKYAATVALTGALALAAAAPSEARNGRNAAAIGFGVGAVAGAAIASSAYNNGYYADPGYAYAPGYVNWGMLTRLIMRMSPVRLTARMPMGPRHATATTVTVGPASTTRTTSRSTRSARLE